MFKILSLILFLSVGACSSDDAPIQSHKDIDAGSDLTQDMTTVSDTGNAEDTGSEADALMSDVGADMSDLAIDAGPLAA